MDSFSFYLKEGFMHITDLNGFDHMLFLGSICLSLQITDFKKIVLAVTAFTIGHSLSLALSVYDQILIPSKLTEWLIPLTILITVSVNLYSGDQHRDIFTRKTLLIALFGVIHGMGFSNFLKNMMGNEENIVLPLFGFNIGLEIGQILIVAFILLLNFTAYRFLKITPTALILFGSGLIFGLAALLCIERWPF